MRLMLMALLGGALSAGFGAGAAEVRLLVFTKTLMYRHASITNGIEALRELASRNGMKVEATEDAGRMTRTNLAGYGAVILLSTSGDILNAEQEGALQEWVEAGGGLVGIHAAIPGKVATEGGWAWYVETFCAEFDNHQAIARATVLVEDVQDASTTHLPRRWERIDEWYNFKASPRGRVHVLASLDEKTFGGGTMGADHPVSWTRRVGKGRVWYTALGHTEESYREREFLGHVLGGIRVAAGLVAADFSVKPRSNPGR